MFIDGYVEIRNIFIKTMHQAGTYTSELSLASVFNMYIQCKLL